MPQINMAWLTTSTTSVEADTFSALIATMKSMALVASASSLIAA
jgi:hypothetical protein